MTTPGSERSADAVRAAARLAKVSGSALADADLTLPQYRVLVFLVARGRPATHVAALLGVTPSTVTSVVDGLVTRGLVQRSSDPADRRRVVLSLTAAGADTVRLGDEVVGAALDRLLARLEPDEAETALVGLELLNKAMEAALDERFGSHADPAPLSDPSPPS
jgi:long-chain acyl-CoA synthetase